MDKEVRAKVEKLGALYGDSFKICFCRTTTESYIKSFASKRWMNTVSDLEIEESERNDPKLQKIFVDIFTDKALKYIESLPKETKKDKKKKGDE